MPRAKAEAFHIRPASPADAAEIARLSGELGYPVASEQTATRLAALLAIPNHHVVVAEGPEGLLGWVAVEQRLLIVSGEKAELMGLVVGSEAQRRGIGRALVAAAEAWAAARGLETIIVRSNAARTLSHPFYECLGYARSKTQHVYAKDLDTGRP